MKKLATIINRHKVILHKLLGDVSLVEQDTIEYVSVGYFKLIIKF